MPIPRFTIQDAINNVKDATLEEWLVRHWDVLLMALDSLGSQTDESFLFEAIRRCRMEIVIGNRLSQLKDDA